MGLVFFKKRRLAKAELSFNYGKQTQAIRRAKPLLHVNNKDISYAANRLSGLAHYKQKAYTKSLPFLEAACHLGNHQHDWYNYAVALAYHGDAENADTAFQNIYRTKVETGYMHSASIPVMLFQYLKALKQKGFTAKAKVRANELKQMYSSIGVLNTSNERSRGLPAYRHFRKVIAPLFDEEELKDWEKNLNIQA